MDPSHQFQPSPEQEEFFSLIEEWRKEKKFPLQQIVQGSTEDLFLYSLLKSWEDIALLLLPDLDFFITKNLVTVLRLIAKNNLFILLPLLKINSPSIRSHQLVGEIIYSSPFEIALCYSSSQVVSIFLGYLSPEEILKIIEKGTSLKPSLFDSLIREDQAPVIREILLATEVDKSLIPYNRILYNFIDTAFRSALGYESEEVLSEIGRWYDLNLLSKNYNLMRYIISSKKERILHHLMRIVPDRREFLINKVLNKICKMGYLSMAQDMLNFFDNKTELLSSLGFVPLKKAVSYGRTELALYLLNLIRESNYDQMEILLNILIHEATMGNREETKQALLNF